MLFLECSKIDSWRIFAGLKFHAFRLGKCRPFWQILPRTQESEKFHSVFCRTFE